MKGKGFRNLVIGLLIYIFIMVHIVFVYMLNASKAQYEINTKVTQIQEYIDKTITLKGEKKR